MAKVVRNKDIVQKDVFKNTIENAESLLVVLDSIEKQFKDILKTSEAIIKIKPENAKDFKVLEENLVKVKKATQAIDNVEKERLKLTQKLKEANSDRIQRNAVLQEQLSTQRKTNKALAREQLGLVDSFDKLNKQSVTAQKRYRNLAVTLGKGAKETKEAAKEARRLADELNDIKEAGGTATFRSVGKSAEEAKKQFGSLSGFLLGVFVGSFQKSRDTAREFNGGLERLGNAVRVLGIAVIEFFKNRALPVINNFFLGIKNLALETQLFFADLLPKSITAFGKTIQIQSDETIEKVKQLKEAIKENGKEIATNKKIIDESSNSFENLGDKIAETDQNIVERLKRQDELINQTAILTQQINLLAAQEAELDVQIGNSSLSFKQRDDLITELVGTQESRLALEEKLGKAELENALTSIENDFIRRDLKEEFNRENVISLEFLKNQAQADAISLENLDKLTAATAGLNAIEAERRQLTLEANKERLENARDEFEQELDFTLDISDRQKSVNEIRIANEKDTLANRKEILAETERLLDDSFDEQIRLTEDFVAKSLEINQGLTEEDSLQAVKDLNIERLVGLEDEKEIRKELFEAGITDEITQNRIREIIIERKAALQDVIDVQNDLKDATEEELDIRADIATQEKALGALQTGNIEKANEAIDDLEEEREANQIASLRRRIAAQVDGSTEQLRLQQELNDALIDQQKKQQEEAEKIRQEGIEKQKEALETAISVLSDILNKRTEERIENIDKEISAEEARIATLEQLANQGNEEAAQSLAVEQKRAAELQVEKERLLRQQEQQQLALTAIELYGQKVAAGDENPLGSTISDITLLKQFVSSLPSFYDGIENTGRGGLDSKGGFMSVLHPNERVVNADNNKHLSGISNNELGEIGAKYNNGLLMDISKFNQIEPQVAVRDRTMNEQMLKEINRNLLSLPKKMPTHDMYYDQLAGILTQVTKDHRGIHKTHQKFKS